MEIDNSGFFRAINVQNFNIEHHNLFTYLNYCDKNDFNIHITQNELNFLIKNTNLKNTTQENQSPLMLLILNNKEKNLFLSDEQWNYLIKNSDLDLQDNDGNNPLMLFLNNNMTQNINLSNENWEYLINNTNLSNQNNLGWNVIMFFIRLYKQENLDFSDSILNTILEKSNVNQEKKDDINAFMLYLLNFQHFNFSDQQLLYFVNNYHNKQKLEDFIKQNKLEKKLDQKHIIFLNNIFNFSIKKKIPFFDKFKKLFTKEIIISNNETNNYLNLIQSNKLTDNLKLKILTLFENLEKIKTINSLDYNYLNHQFNSLLNIVNDELKINKINEEENLKIINSLLIYADDLLKIKEEQIESRKKILLSSLK